MARLLLESGIVVAHKYKKTMAEQEGDRDINERVVAYQNYLTSQQDTNASASVRVSKKALTTVATWAEMHNS